MSKVYSSIEQLIGNTPILELTSIKANEKLYANVFAKLELFNPAGSAKDRVAKGMLEDAFNAGIIDANTTIIEPTSGNTGIGLCMVAAKRGLKVIIVMPENMSLERKKLMNAFGASLVLTNASEGMTGAINKAKELANEIPNSYIPGQFDNPSNAKSHFDTTGPEIYNDMDGKVDIFVSCVGTGGTITGTGEYLKSRNSNIKVVAVEPLSSAFLSTGKAGAHKIQGIGAGFIPEVLNTEVYDEIITVSDEDAFSYGRMICKTEGVLVGISSGAALCAAIKLAKQKDNEGKNIVVLLPDTGERYLSTEMF